MEPKDRPTPPDARAQHRAFVLEHVVNGGLTLDQAAAILKLSTRQVGRLLARHADGPAARRGTGAGASGWPARASSSRPTGQSASPVRPGPAVRHPRGRDRRRDRAGARRDVPLSVLAVPLALLWRRAKSISYLVCFSAFFLYLWAFVAVTIFPLRLDQAYIEYMRQYRTWAQGFNLVPFAFGNDVESVQIYGNILLGVPFGFGLPFVIPASLRRVAISGIGLGVGTELIQLAIGLVYGFPYRVVDINDAILNFGGVMAGYAILKVCARAYRRLAGGGMTNDALFSHIAAVLLAA